MIESMRRSAQACLDLAGRSCLRRFALAILVTAASAQAAEGAESTGGFVAELAAADARGRMHLETLVSTRPPARAASARRAGDWSLVLLDEGGTPIHIEAVAAPIGSDPYAPRRIAFADRGGAVLAELRDPAGQLRAELPLDSLSRDRANARGGDLERRRLAAMRGPKRSDDPARRAAAERQVDANALRRGRLAEPCTRSEMRRRAPEWIVPASGCDDPDVTRRAAFARPPLAARPPLREPSPEIIAVGGGSTPAAEHALSGRLTFPDGEPVPTSTVYLYIYDAQGPGSYEYRELMPPDFAFGTVVVEGARPVLHVDAPPLPWLARRSTLAPVTGPVDVDLELEKGAVLGGHLQLPPGQSLDWPPYDTLTVWNHDGTGYGVYVPIDETLHYAIAVKPGMKPLFQFSPPAPLLSQEIAAGLVLADRTMDIRVRAGVGVTASVIAPDSPYGIVTVVDYVSGLLTEEFSDWSNAPSFGVEPRFTTIEGSAPEHRPSEAHVPGSEDHHATFELESLADGHSLAVSLRDPHGQPVNRATVEVWSGARRVTSARSVDGAASFTLAQGTYRLIVWPDSEDANRTEGGPHWLFPEPALTTDVAVAAATAIELDVSPAYWKSMSVRFPKAAPWPACPNPVEGTDAAMPAGRLELLRNGVVVARGPFRLQTRAADRRQALHLSGGRWRLRFVAPGDKVYLTEEFTATEGGSIALKEASPAPPRRWRGVLRDHLGTPVAVREIRLADELGLLVYNGCPVRTDVAGRFTLPLCADCEYEFRAVSTQPSQRRIVRPELPATGDLVEDLRLGPPLAFAALPPSGPGRVFGTADAPFRLVFLAEGYAAEQESFTDIDGDGAWDGVQFVDLDLDGLWDSGEPYAQYGGAPAPVADADPRAGNEPFLDLNGDGVLSLDDRALFERNVRDYLRGLFSAHQFAQYRGAYQATALMAYSAQVGIDHPGVQARDTLFGATFVPGRGLLNVDYDAATQAAIAADPGHTAVVVMINQPVPYGRVNSFILASGGPLRGDVNDTVAAHEFGHNPGGLADEYEEFVREFLGPTPWGFHNAARFLHRDQIAWGRHVAVADDGRPTKPWMAASGLFEGAQYHTGMAYRPSTGSVMRFNRESLRFNAASVDRLRQVHADALRGRPGLLTVGPASCRTFTASWAAGSSGAGPFELRAGDPQGPLLGAGASGSVAVKPLVGDLFLVDAAEGVVVDVQAAPIVRCAGS